MYKRILQLIQDIDRNGYTGIGKPESLKADLTDGGLVVLIQKTESFIELKQIKSKLFNVNLTIGIIKISNKRQKYKLSQGKVN